MKSYWSVVLMFSYLFVVAANSRAAESTAELLWPAQVPGEQTPLSPEVDTTKPDGDLVAGRRVLRLGNVSSPTITFYAPSAEKNTGAAVLVCPGGGYHILAMDLEGTEVCEWLQSIGVTGVLLKYRVPRRSGPFATAAGRATCDGVDSRFGEGARHRSREDWSAGIFGRGPPCGNVEHPSRANVPDHGYS